MYVYLNAFKVYCGKLLENEQENQEPPNQYVAGYSIFLAHSVHLIPSHCSSSTLKHISYSVIAHSLSKPV